MMINLDKLPGPAIAAVLSAALLLSIRAFAFGILHRWAERSKTQLDNIIIRSLRMPSVYWCLAVGLYMGAAVSEFPQKYISYLSKIIYIILILSVTIAAANLAGNIFRSYIQKSDLPVPTTGLAYGILKGTIIILGFLIILSVLGISIAPLLTALGVGGLAVALALKDTLANLFAGIHMLMEKSIRVGDFIKLETGQEGCVEDITWRTTRVRIMQNNIVVIPNSTLSQSIVTNYSLPDRRMSVLMPVSVSYSSDPAKVEQVLVEVAKTAVGDIQGLLGDPEPTARCIPGFGDSSLDFTLICQVREFADQYPVQHELRKRIVRRFRQEGIEIPFPHRTLYIREGREVKNVR